MDSCAAAALFVFRAGKNKVRAAQCSSLWSN
jgi:hypothetical protein